MSVARKSPIVIDHEPTPPSQTWAISNGADVDIYRRFDTALEQTGQTWRPDLDNMLDALGRVEAQKMSSQCALVRSGMNADFDAREMRDIFTIRRLLALLGNINEHKDEVTKVLRSKRGNS